MLPMPNYQPIVNKDYHFQRSSDRKSRLMPMVLQIPSKENACEEPTLLVCSSDGMTQEGVDDIFTLGLDELFSQLKQDYAEDPEALKRFSYYLVLKAKELSGS